MDPSMQKFKIGLLQSNEGFLSINEDHSSRKSALKMDKECKMTITKNVTDLLVRVDFKTTIE